MTRRGSALVIVGVALSAASVSATAEPIPVGPAIYRPLFANKGEQRVAVPRFHLDETPVTNADFLRFVSEAPQWQRGRVKALFADGAYLARWQSPLDLGPQAPPRAPVVEVSWFAARAYCQWRGGRLPREAEWEVAAAASETVRDASRDPRRTDQILAWYAKPTPAILADVGGVPNTWGIRDLHGLVWEWIEDFSAALVAGDDRGRAAAAEMFCGGAASSSSDPNAYAAFMRLAYRSALGARYTTASLGFRCAYDIEEKP